MIKRKINTAHYSMQKALIFCILFTALGWYFSVPSDFLGNKSLASVEFPHLEKKLSQVLVNSINENIAWPNSIEADGKAYQINYTINPHLENYLKELLAAYPSAYTSVVILDNNTGAILSALDYDAHNKVYGKNLTFTPSSPAASLFKIITAADAIEQKGTRSEDIYYFSGRASTLYRNQLEIENHFKRYLKPLTLQKAFAHSNNVVFGKVALKHSDAVKLYQTATKFGFNQEIFDLVKLPPSYVPVAVDDYNLAELASGLNTLTLLSPLHAAKIAMTIANNGRARSLKLIKSLMSLDGNPTDEALLNYPFQNENSDAVISETTAQELQKMMRETVASGTAKVISHKLNKNLLEKLDIGGKTGQMTGGIPEGKRDWFITFVRPKNKPADKGISIAVMIVNQNRWYIRSTQLAKEIIQYSYNNLFVLDQPKNYYSYHKSN